MTHTQAEHRFQHRRGDNHVAAVNEARATEEISGTFQTLHACHCGGWHVLPADVCHASGKPGGKPIHESRDVALLMKPLELVHVHAYHCKDCDGWHSAKPLVTA